MQQQQQYSSSINSIKLLCSSFPKPFRGTAATFGSEFCVFAQRAPEGVLRAASATRNTDFGPRSLFCRRRQYKNEAPFYQVRKKRFRASKRTLSGGFRAYIHAYIAFFGSPAALTQGQPSGGGPCGGLTRLPVRAGPAKVLT